MKILKVAQFDIFENKSSLWLKVLHACKILHEQYFCWFHLFIWAQQIFFSFQNFIYRKKIQIKRLFPDKRQFHFSPESQKTNLDWCKNRNLTEVEIFSSCLLIGQLLKKYYMVNKTMTHKDYDLFRHWVTFFHCLCLISHRTSVELSQRDTLPSSSVTLSSEDERRRGWSWWFERPGKAKITMNDWSVAGFVCNLFVCLYLCEGVLCILKVFQVML